MNNFHPSCSPAESPAAKPVICFDADDTLYVRSQPFVAACRKMFEPHFLLPWEKVFEARCRYGDQVFDDAQYGKITIEESYIFRITRALQDFGQEITPDQALAFERCFEDCIRQIRLEPGLSDVLDMLKENGIPMAVLTNGPAGHQRPKLDSLGVSRWIPEEYWCISGEMQSCKPHAAYFREAEQKLSCRPENSWLVGDSFYHDIEGAASAGWHSVWYTRKLDPAPTEISPADRAAHSPQELKQVLAEILQLNS